jgi:hypothetical protein
VNANPEPERSAGSTCFGEFCWSTFLLTMICAAVGLLVASVGYARSGWTGILAAVLAWAVCWGGAVVSLVIARLVGAGSQTASGVLLAAPIRMGVPLLACVMLVRQGSQLVDAGVIVMILPNYFVTLVADTWLLLRCRVDRVGIESVSRVS